MRVHTLLLLGALFLLGSLACTSNAPANKTAETPKVDTGAASDGAPALPAGQATPGANEAQVRAAEFAREEADRKAREERGETTQPETATETATPVAAATGPSYVANMTPLPAFANREAVDPADKVGVMRTTAGDIYFFFYPKDAPNHDKNFIYLAAKGFYRDVRFHRIEPSFVIQAGEARADWTEPEVTLKLEANKTRIHIPGAMSAARTSDPNSASSQFYFVITRESAQHLDGQYTVFGQSFRGQDVINELGANKSNESTAKIIDVQIFDAAPFADEIAAFKKTHEISG